MDALNAKGLDGFAIRVDALSFRSGSQPVSCPTITVDKAYSANCDGIGGLTANDFACFLSLYANGNAAANCDGSIGSPLLRANAFACFVTAYASGCQ